FPSSRGAIGRSTAPNASNRTGPRLTRPLRARPTGVRPARSYGMRRFLLGFLLGVASVLAVLVGIGHYLDVDDPLAKADAIVAISGDTGARTETAVRLWKQGYAPVLIFSGASQDPQSVASAELMKRAAVAAGVPSD